MTEPEQRAPACDRRDRALGWSLVAGLLALGAVLVRSVNLGLQSVLEWQPAQALEEPWRWWSAAWVHYSTMHLQANLLGTLLVAALGWAARLPREAAMAWALAWPLTQLGLMAQPELLRYGGLSGVLHAGVAVAAVWLAARRPRRERIVGLALLAGLALKLASETPWLGPLRHATGWDIAIAPGAHVSGSLSGLLCGGLMLLARARRPVSPQGGRAPC